MLSGCWWGGPQGLEVTVTPTEGYPSVAAGGLLVRFACHDGGPSWELVPGDGSGGVVFQRSTFSYLYPGSGVFEYQITSGGAVANGTVTVINGAPQVYESFTSYPDSTEWMAKKMYDAQYRFIGCGGSGEPLGVYGVWDPEGDPIVSYAWEVSGPNNNGQTVSYSVFDSQRRNITGQITNDPLMVFFAGWTEVEPPYSFFVNPMCGRSDPVPLPAAAVAWTITLTLTAWDIWGGEDTFSWTIDIWSLGCGSS